MFFRKGQEKTNLKLKPFIDGIYSENLELSKEFKDVVFFQTYIEDNPKILEYFNIMDDNIWDYKNKIFNPRIISVKNGVKFYDQSNDRCYCLETLIEMIFELYPELIPEPTSEG
jgi:hypothetical protein